MSKPFQMGAGAQFKSRNTERDLFSNMEITEKPLIRVGLRARNGHGERISKVDREGQTETKRVVSNMIIRIGATIGLIVPPYYCLLYVYFIDPYRPP